MSETYTMPAIQEQVAIRKILDTPYPEAKMYPTPQQTLLAFAESLWGKQFDDNGDAQWGCFSEVDGISTGKYAGITDGREYFVIYDDSYKSVQRWLVYGQGELHGVQDITLASSTTSPKIQQQMVF